MRMAYVSVLFFFFLTTWNLHGIERPAGAVPLIEAQLRRLAEAERRGDVAVVRACMESVEFAQLAKRLGGSHGVLSPEDLRRHSAPLVADEYLFREFHSNGNRAIVWYSRAAPNRPGFHEHFFVCCQQDVDGWKIGPRIIAQAPEKRDGGEETQYRDFLTIKPLDTWL